MAIESYNRPSLHNRVEVFTILITNAWELLLKAEIIKASDNIDAIFYKDSDRSLAIRDALKQRIPKENDPVRKNLEKVCDLRDNAVHLLIPELQAHWSRLFQANVLNFITRYEDATGENLFNSGRGMLSLIVDREAAELATIKLKFGEASAETVELFLQRFLADEEELDTPNFAIPVDYRLVLTKANQQGDIVLSHGEGGRRAIKVVQSRNIDKTHPHLMMEAVELIGERLPEHHVTRPRVTAICEKHHIYNSPGSKYYDEIQKPFTRRFSDTFVDWVVEKASEDTEWIERAWDWYS
ncbi:DUF3644 domain-containing protein [Persicimonas caeni]|uniref:DUF3644 domain-containing protein n=1 Tax=Persicimonas caeni TaxID=2292766 RepID=UPI00143D9153|nr:DUF3644 domain-containing protein [Persicimonas caeni]